MYENEDIILGKLRTNREQLENIVQQQLPLKRDKSVKINTNDIDKTDDTKKIHLLDLANEVQAAMSGTAPVISSVLDGTITPRKTVTYDRFRGKNLYDFTTCTDGAYRPYTTGGIAVNASFSYSGYIEVVAGDIITISRKNGLTIGSIHVAFYNDLNVFVSGALATTAVPTVTTPSGATKLIFSMGTTDKAGFQLEKGNVVTSFVNFIAEYYKLKPQYIKINEITYDGTKNLRVLLKDITDASELNPYIVYLPNGTYSPLNYYSTEEKAVVGFVGLFVPDHVTLCGIGDRDSVIITASFATADANVSTLNLAGTAGLKNLTVIGVKTRYTIHDDFATRSTYDKYYYRNIENCVIIADQCYYGSAYGSGTRSGAIWKFKNCNFIGGLGIHDNVSFAVANDITFENCKFSDNTTQVINIKSLGSGVTNRIHFIGCDIPNIYINEETDGAGNYWVIDGNGNNEILYRVESTITQNIVCEFREEVKMLRANSTLNKGDLVYKSSYTGAKMSGGTNVRKFVGIAMKPAVSGDWIPVKRKGYVAITDTALTGVADGDNITITSALLAKSTVNTDYVIGVVETHWDVLFLHLI